MTNWPYVQSQKDNHHLAFENRSMERELQRSMVEIQKLKRKIKKLETELEKLRG